MVQIGNNQGYSGYRSMADLLAKRTSAPRATTELPQKPYEPKGREINDTVEVSGAGKIVNLARGNDLAREIRAEKDPAKVREMIAAGTSDIKRIGNLFGETFKAMFSLFRRSP
jgi:hypothetical protein